MIPIFMLIFIFGLVIGSFLNVVILRTISNESIVFPGSKCPKCQTPLKWYHNIPLFSYLFLRGKCAYCKEHISLQYPLVELFTGLSFLLIGFLYLNNIFSIEFPIHVIIVLFLTVLAVISLLIVISGTDFKEMLVSDIHTYSLMGIAVLYSVYSAFINFFPDTKFGIYNWKALFMPVLFTIIAIFAGFVFMEIIRRGLNCFMQAETFGDGDSYILAGIMGILTSLYGFTGIKQIILMLFVVFMLSAVITVIISMPIYIKQLISDKNWGILSVLSIFIIYSATYFYVFYNAYIQDFTILFAAAMVLLILGLSLCFMIVQRIKNNYMSSIKIPFGPALCSSCLVGLIILPFIIGII